MADLTKLQRIKKEESRLNKIFKDFKDGKKFKTAQPLICRAAFLKATLEDYELDINTYGSVEMFQQGKEQEPYERERPVVRQYNQMNSQYAKIIKQLTDLLPDETAGKIKDELLDFIGGKK